MKIAVTHIYNDESSWGVAILDTDLLEKELATKLIASLRKESIELSYDVMQSKEMKKAEVKTFPVTVNGVLEIFEKRR